MLDQLKIKKVSSVVNLISFYRQQEPQEQQVLPLAQAQGLILEVRRLIHNIFKIFHDIFKML